MPVLSPTRRSSQFSPGKVLWLIVLLFATGPLAACADWKDDVGYTQLVNSLGVLGIPVPNGNGVPISLVESGGNAYWPDTNHADFSASSDPLGQATTFIDGTNAAGRTVGSHSTSMVRTFFGHSLSISPVPISLSSTRQITSYNRSCMPPTARFLRVRASESRTLAGLAVSMIRPWTLPRHSRLLTTFRLCGTSIT